MKKNFLLSVLVSLLLISAAFTGCDLYKTDSFEMDAVERSISASASASATATETEAAAIPFTAVVQLQQVPGSAVTTPSGQGVHWKTRDEVLTGYVVSSDWPELIGAEVTMENSTNFFFTPREDGTFDISGTNQSSIVMKLANEELSLKARGKIAGNIPFGAQLDMSFNSVGTKGSASDTKLKGSVTGGFVWYTAPPSGEIYLSGVRNQ